MISFSLSLLWPFLCILRLFSLIFWFHPAFSKLVIQLSSACYYWAEQIDATVWLSAGWMELNGKCTHHFFIFLGTLFLQDRDDTYISQQDKAQACLRDKMHSGALLETEHTLMLDLGILETWQLYFQHVVRRVPEILTVLPPCIPIHVPVKPWQRTRLLCGRRGRGERQWVTMTGK